MKKNYISPQIIKLESINLTTKNTKTGTHDDGNPSGKKVS